MIKIKKWVLVNSLMFFAFATSALAKNVTAKVGTWQITYDTATHSFQYSHNGNIVIHASRPEASYSLKGVKHKVTAANFKDAKTSKTATGTRFSLTNGLAGDGIDMIVDFYAHGDGLITRLILRGQEEIASNYLAPLCTAAPQQPSCYKGGDAQNLRMLRVPFDNDDFIRYLYNRLDTRILSYEASAIFNGESCEGLVIGSIDHDHWKSGVEIKGANYDTIERLRAYSGVSSKETRDVLPHGALVGQEVASARFFMDDAKDWRDGLEAFASACCEVQPGRHTWTGGTPFGWQSWGVMSSHNSMSVDVAVADYYAETLRAAGFCSSPQSGLPLQSERAGGEAKAGLQIMSIDAWDNLNREQKRELTAHCEAQGQIAGLYRSPFALWWGSEDDLQRPLFRGCDYKAIDCVLKAHGRPIKYDGAFCLDPTHPATKQMMTRDMEEARRQGFRYVKVDFVCNGIIQADSYYNKNVRTAVEAYNEGMEHFASQCYDKDGLPMFIALSIAPIFPYQYGNSRRIACDTWGKINQSEYAMNAICGGWWTNIFYQRNDPDHIVLVGNDEEKETEGENRARFTTGVCSGMILLADNYDIADTVSHCGNAQLSRERAKIIVCNREVNALARKVTRSFRPVYAHRPYNGEGATAGNFVTQTIDGTTYVAIINYSDTPMKGELPFSDLGVEGKCTIKELWTGSLLPSTCSLLPYEVPCKDARIYQITQKK